MSHVVVCIALLLTAPPLNAASEAKSDIDAEQASAEREIERAARDYRIHVYESFRQNRAEYDARRSAGDKLLEAWQACGRPTAYEHDVLTWLRAAHEASIASAARDLPELPHLPDPLPEVADDADPTAAPHLPGKSRLDVDFRPTGAQQKPSLDSGFLRRPTPVDANRVDAQATDGYDGPLFTPPSKILRSIQRALLSSMAEEAMPSEPVIEYPVPFNDTPFNDTAAPREFPLEAPELNQP